MKRRLFTWSLPLRFGPRRVVSSPLCRCFPQPYPVIRDVGEDGWSEPSSGFSYGVNVLRPTSVASRWFFTSSSDILTFCSSSSNGRLVAPPCASPSSGSLFHSFPPFSFFKTATRLKTEDGFSRIQNIYGCSTRKIE